MMIHNDFMNKYRLNNFTTKEMDVFYSIVSIMSEGKNNINLKLIKEKLNITFSYQRLINIIQNIADKSLLKLDTKEKIPLFQKLKLDTNNKKMYIEFNNSLRYLFSLPEPEEKELDFNLNTDSFVTISKLMNIMSERNIQTISELQKITKISRATLQKLYSNTKVETVSLKFIKDLCVVLNCSIDQIIVIQKKED